MLIDTHAHLDLSEFQSDLDAVLNRARQASVTHIVTVGIDLASSRQAVTLARQHSDISAAIGVHPHDANSWDEAVASEFEILARDPKVVAIGETGLDFYRNRCPRDVQIAAFRAQLALADKVGLPIIVHAREAQAEVMAELRLWARGVAEGGNRVLDGRLGVLHCFSGDIAMAEELIGLGFYISFAGPVTYPKSDRLTEVASKLPLDRFVVETDAPFLPPQTKRGQRNEPVGVVAVAEKIAELRAVSCDVVAKASTSNARTLFGLS